jgi:tyrosinase
MLNGWSSINDPLFFMHHGNLDRIWAIWQKKSSSNVYAIGGPTYPNGTGETTLDTTIDMGKYMAPSIPARQLMDTTNNYDHGVLCYEYADYLH